VANIALRNLGGGEIAPALYARTDALKYATGLRTCRNFMVLAHGAIGFRPGLELVASTKGNARERLVPWVFDGAVASQNYVLSFGDGYLRFTQSGGQLVVPSATAWNAGAAYAIGDLVSDAGVIYYAKAAQPAGAGHQPAVGADWQTYWVPLTMDGTSGIYEIPSPYLASELAGLQYVQSADVMTIVSPAHPIYELRRYGHTDWTLTPVTIGPVTLTPSGLGLSGGIAGAVTYYAVTAVSETTGEESLSGVVSASNRVPDVATPTVVGWSPVTGAIEYNLYRSTDGVTFGYIGTAGGTPLHVTDTSWTGSPNSVSHAPSGGYTASGTQARNAVVTVAAEKSTDGKYRITGTLLLTTTGGFGSFSTARVSIYYQRNTDSVRVLATTTTPVTVTSVGGNQVDVDESIDVPDDGYTTLQFDVVPEVNAAVGITSGTATFTGASVQFDQGGTTFSDAAIDPDYTQNPPTQAKLFDTPATFPAVIGSYQQRRMVANTSAQPERSWGSKTGLPNSFATSFPLEDDDMVSWDLVGDEVNVVRHLRDMGTLIEFTSAAVYEIQGNEAHVLTPGAISPRLVSSHGASAVRPLKVGDTLLFVQARGSTVRDLRPDAVSSTGYQGNDLTVYAKHLVRGYTVTDWAYAAEPYSHVWVLRSDGVLLCLTYVREEGVWGWSRHDTRGVVESVAVVPEGDQDRLYCVVRRTINGGTVRFLERMAAAFVTDVTAIEDAVFMDACLSYDGRNATTTTLSFSDGLTPHLDTVFCVASAAIFLASHVGNELRVMKGGVPVSFTITAYTNATHVTGYWSDHSFSGAFGLNVGTVWTFAVDVIDGLDALEGESVAVLADGYVVSSPNNTSRTDARTVVGGSIALGANYAVVHIGLPYLGDVETLDIDTASGPSLKESAIRIGKVTALVESTRGLWAGITAPSDDTEDPLEGLREYAAGEQEGDPDYDAPPPLLTGSAGVEIDGTWNDHGRVFMRQVDPLPATILALIPQGTISRGS
jgi:hypothetical protein